MNLRSLGYLSAKHSKPIQMAVHSVSSFSTVIKGCEQYDP